jgi:membrane dipeptidase
VHFRPLFSHRIIRIFTFQPGPQLFHFETREAITYPEMTRWTLLTLLVASPTLVAQPRPISDRLVQQIHRSATLIDTHNDVTGRTVDGFDIGPRGTDGHTDLVRLKEGGVSAVFFAVFVAASYVDGNHSANRALRMIDTIRHDIIDRYPRDFVLATSADQIVRAKKTGRIAALLGIEGGHAIEDDLRLLRQFFNLGVRYMTLTHTNSNNWADSSGSVEKPHNGLSPLGRTIVKEMNQLGMIVDISHVSDKTFWDTLEASEAPIFASHSSCRAISDVPRNMTDDMIRALAKKGGVIQINFDCGYLNYEVTQKQRTLMSGLRDQIAERLKASPEKTRSDVVRELMTELDLKLPKASIDDVVKHIGHVVRIAGIDHVGIGSDFDGVLCVPTDLDEVNKFPNLTRKLLERGYSASDVHKIYGANTLRLMRAVEATARRLQSPR